MFTYSVQWEARWLVGLLACLVVATLVAGFRSTRAAGSLTRFERYKFQLAEFILMVTCIKARDIALVTD